MNIKQYLEDKGIEYKEAGQKNVTRGWINIQCPFSYCGDKTNHLGINLSSGGWHCWICNTKNQDISYLIKEIEQCSITKAKNIVNHYDDGIGYKEKIVSPSDKVWFPPGIVDYWPSEHLEYLEDRNFDIDKLINTYKLLPIGLTGKYNNRIFIPFFVKRKMVTWQSADIVRDITLDRIPYLNCPIEKSIIPLNHCLYNYDSIKYDKAIIVEGVTDVWRLGEGAVATCTKNFTKEQLLLLKKKNIKSVFVIYDSDATQKSKELSILLSGIFDHAEYIQLEKGDPADMTNQQAKELRRDIGI